MNYVGDALIVAYVLAGPAMISWFFVRKLWKKNRNSQLPCHGCGCFGKGVTNPVTGMCLSCYTGHRGSFPYMP